MEIFTKDPESFITSENSYKDLEVNDENEIALFTKLVDNIVSKRKDKNVAENYQKEIDALFKEGEKIMKDGLYKKAAEIMKNPSNPELNFVNRYNKLFEIYNQNGSIVISSEDKKQEEINQKAQKTSEKIGTKLGEIRDSLNQFLEIKINNFEFFDTLLVHKLRKDHEGYA